MRNRFSFGLLPHFAPPDDLGGGGGGTSVGGSSSGTPAGAGSDASSGTASPSQSDAGSQQGASDFSFLNDIFSDPSSAAPPPAQAGEQVPPTQQPGTQPPPPAQQPPVQAPPPAQQPPPAQAQPGTEQQPQPAVQPQFDPADPHSLARALTANHDAIMNHLSENVFKMSPQELEELETNVAGSVPKLLAKTVMFMQTQNLMQLGRIIPLMIQRHGEVNTRHSKNVDAFYAAWPSIDKSKHGDVVQKTAIAFRQLNPEVPTDKMIETLGPILLSMLNLPMVQMTRAGGTQVARQQPPQNARGNGAFQPAAPGAVSVHQTPVADPFGYLGATD